MPRYGILGAAVSWSASIIIFNLVRVFQVHKILGMLPFDFALVKGLAAAQGLCW